MQSIGGHTGNLFEKLINKSISAIQPLIHSEPFVSVCFPIPSLLPNCVSGQHLEESNMRLDWREDKEKKTLAGQDKWHFPFSFLSTMYPWLYPSYRSGFVSSLLTASLGLDSPSKHSFFLPVAERICSERANEFHEFSMNILCGETTLLVPNLLTFFRVFWNALTPIFEQLFFMSPQPKKHTCASLTYLLCNASFLKIFFQDLQHPKRV